MSKNKRSTGSVGSGGQTLAPPPGIPELQPYGNAAVAERILRLSEEVGDERFDGQPVLRLDQDVGDEQFDDLLGELGEVHLGGSEPVLRLGEDVGDERFDDLEPLAFERFVSPDGPAANESLVEALGVFDKVSDGTVFATAGGTTSTGFDMLGGAEGPLSGWDAEQRRENTNVVASGTGDELGGLTQGGVGLLALLRAAAQLKEGRKDKDKGKIAESAATGASGAASLLGGGLRTLYGGLDQARGEVLSYDDLRIGGDMATLFAALPLLGLQAVEAGTSMGKMLGKSWTDRSWKTNTRRGLEGATKGAALARDTLGTGLGAFQLTHQLLQGGAGVAEGAQAISTGVSQLGLGPLGLAVGTGTMALSTIAAIRSEKHHRALGKASGAVEDHSDEKLAFEHLQENERKKQARAGIDGTVGAIGAVGGGFSVSGLGILPGLLLLAASAGIKASQLITRFAKQTRRDKAADRFAALDAKGQERSWSEQIAYDELRRSNELRTLDHLLEKKRKGQLTDAEAAQLAEMQRGRPWDLKDKLSSQERFDLQVAADLTKSTTRKRERDDHTAQAILDMEPDQQQVALGALRLDARKWGEIDTEEATEASKRAAVAKAIRRR